MSVHVNMYYLSLSLSLYVYVFIYAYVYVHIYVYIYIYMNVYIYICICVHIYTCFASIYRYTIIYLYTGLTPSVTYLFFVLMAYPPLDVPNNEWKERTVEICGSTVTSHWRNYS